LESMFPPKELSSTKQKILEVAIDLFSEQGFSAVSVRNITKVVGIKESALYNHYKTKDEILETIYSLYITQQQRTLPPVHKLEEILGATSPEQFLLQGFQSFKLTVSNPLMMKLWRILNIEQYRDRRAGEIILQYTYRNTLTFLQAAFDILISQKKIKPADTKMLAFQYQYPIFTAMTEYVLLKTNDRDTSELEQLVEAHIQDFIKNTKPS
jgi:AcrR family transcriptional regulator